MTSKNGKRAAIIETVRRDDIFMLAIGTGYINVYYRGGGILRLSEEAGAIGKFSVETFGVEREPAIEHDPVVGGLQLDAGAADLTCAPMNAKSHWPHIGFAVELDVSVPLVCKDMLLGHLSEADASVRVSLCP